MPLPDCDDSLPSLGGDSMWSLDENNYPKRRSLAELMDFISTTAPKRRSKDRTSSRSSSSSASSNQAGQSSEWTSETTRNLLARIKELKDSAQQTQLPSSPRPSLATEVVKTPPSVSPPVCSTSSPLTHTPIASTPPSTWKSRKLSASTRRDSLTSLFNAPSSINIASKIPKLDLKKRFRKNSTVTVFQYPGSPTPGSPNSRIRHIPLVGLGIEGVDPFVENFATSSLDLACGAAREDSNATLVPIQQRESTSSQSIASSNNTVATELSASARTTAATSVHSMATSSRSTSLESQPSPLSRSRSANLLSAPWSSATSHQSPTLTSSSPASGPPGLGLRRFRSFAPLASTTNTSYDGIIIDPSTKAQKARFNRAFGFPMEDTASTTSTDFASKFRLRRVRALNELKNSKLARKFSGSRNDILIDPVMEDGSSRTCESADVNAQSYDEQLVNLRVKLGLPARNGFHTGPPHLAHPHHDFAWDTKNLRCLVCPASLGPISSMSPITIATPSSKHVTHLHPAMRSEFASRPPTSDSSATITPDSSPVTSTQSSLDLLTHVHPALRSRLHLALRTASPPTSPPTMVTPYTPLTCALCPTTCCIYSALLASPLPACSRELTLFREIIRLTAPGTPLGRSAGRNPFSTFVKCGNSDCGKMVCPDCASRCRLVGCAEVVCRACREREGGGWICGWHEEE